MKNSPFSTTAITLCAMFTLSAAMPSEAMPVPQQQLSANTDAQSVKMERKKPVVRKNRAVRNRSSMHKQTVVRRHTVVRNNHSWRGHRGYTSYRPGYRRYNGFWYPPAAFSVGVVIGRTGNAHVRWCRNNYISYRVSDDTFQPNSGPRRACISP